MAEEETTRKSPEELTDRAWELMEKIRIALLTTHDGDSLDTRPLSATVDQDEHAIYFLVSATGDKNGQIEENPLVTLAFADNGGSKYVVVQGSASLSDDRAKIKELWTPFAKAWWDDENDPDIRLLTVIPHQAELWDSPNMIVSSAIMLAAAVTGAKPAVGEHAKVDV